ncbi:hypothetical protein [Citrobacter sp. JGM124]|uniref:hypothetical protein n=1 Tax=Citrobacter sp. JGM124 TaxID=2799789 RepID=UPI001BA7894F|nr:hypothetical protein [Citrobacter sp. JGM124]MBS0849643.1 hypothetical protein [Citrobacter sp. JGM124]
MPVSQIPHYSRECSKELPVSISQKNHSHNKNSSINKISIIINSTLLTEKNKNEPSGLTSVANHIISIKNKIFKKTDPPAFNDTELERILSQGRALSHDSENIYNLINDKNSISSPRTPSSNKTNKMEIILGGMLISSAIVGGGIYYCHRSGHEKDSHSSDASVFRNPIPSSLTSYEGHNPFHAHAPVYASNPISKKTDDIFYHDVKYTEKIKRGQGSNDIYFKQGKNIKLKKASRKNERSPCPPINKQLRKEILKTSYSYTKKQSSICLTDTFNARCQRAHRQAQAKRGCLRIPHNMILKITGRYCFCPPPDWLEMRQIEPPLLKNNVSKQRAYPFKKKTATPPTIPARRKTSTYLTIPTTPKTSAQTNTPRLDPIFNHDEMVKNNLPESHGYIVPQKQHLDTLPRTTLTPVNPHEEPQTVTKISLTDCYLEREDLNLSTSLRIISRTLNNPISNLVKEGKIVFQSEFASQFCANNTALYEELRDIESVIDSLLSWVPGYNRAKFLVKLVASLLESLSDALDGKDIDINNILDLNSQLTGLSKDVISSIKTKDVNSISKDTNREKIKNIIAPLEFKKSELIINTSHGEKIKTERKFNHLFDSKKNGFIFYDSEKKWTVDNNIKSNEYIRETFELAKESWKDTENIFFFKNSSPDIYGDGIILRYNGDIYTLIDGSLYKTTEIQLTDTIFRYVIKDNDKFLPIAHRGEAWFFEESKSPAASDDLDSFLKNNNKINNMLISNHIKHQDVSPLTPGRDIQFDKDFNEYLKINNKYYKLSRSIDTSHYIEGEHTLLALELVDNQFHIKESLFDGICCFHKEPINIIEEINQDGVFFLDNTVTSKINSFKFQSNRLNTISRKDVTTVHFKKSEDIEGAITINDNSYIYYKHDFIKAHSKYDGRYILGDETDDFSNIFIYKNIGSRTYYSIPKTKPKWSELFRKSHHCIAKRQPLSMCNTEYFETERIRYLLTQHNNHRITINNYQDILSPHKEIPGIYKKNNSEDEFYYKYEGDDFFHVRLNKDHEISFTPAFFIIYGKTPEQKIDLNSVISGVNIIKDFDSKKIIFSTPRETQESVFDINKKISDMYLKWQEQDTVYRDATLDDLKEIVKNSRELNDISSLNELFDRNGKKVVTSIEYAEKIFKDKIDHMITAPDSLDIKNLQNLEDSHTYPVVGDICSKAFTQALKYIKDATATIEESSEKLDSYIINILKISDEKARNIFISSLKKKLHRMTFIFDDNNKENIIIITRKNSVDKNKETLSSEGKNTLGFSILNDPLDRIFINTAVIADIHEESPATKTKDFLEVPSIPQPETPRRNRVFFTNLIAETMLHEAIHALGSPEDYLYLNVNEEGRIDNVDDSIKHIETSITEGGMDRIKFEYLSKIYFQSNPLYKGLTSTSLKKPEILKDIFRDDGFFRSIVLLNNPDTISLLIRELAGIPPNEEEGKT